MAKIKSTRLCISAPLYCRANLGMLLLRLGTNISKVEESNLAKEIVDRFGYLKACIRCYKYNRAEAMRKLCIHTPEQVRLIVERSLLIWNKSIAEFVFDCTPMGYYILCDVD